MFSTHISLWANFVCSEVLGIALIRLDCGFLFQGLNSVLGSEPGVANINAQEKPDHIITEGTDLVGTNYGKSGSICAFYIRTAPNCVCVGVWSESSSCFPIV